MSKYRFIVFSLIFIVVQIFICNYFPFSRYVLISILPALLLMLPLEYGSNVSMLIAFAAGFAVDFFSTGMLGITSASLVPAALLRQPLISFVFGDEISSRAERIIPGRIGLPKMSLAMLLLCAVFFVCYVWMDAADTSGFWSGALRFALSVAASAPLCVLVAGILRPE